MTNKTERYSFAEFPETAGTTLVVYDSKGKNVKQLPCLSKKELKAVKILLSKGVLPG